MGSGGASNAKCQLDVFNGVRFEPPGAIFSQPLNATSVSSDPKLSGRRNPDPQSFFTGNSRREPTMDPRRTKSARGFAPIHFTSLYVEGGVQVERAHLLSDPGPRFRLETLGPHPEVGGGCPVAG